MPWTNYPKQAPIRGTDDALLIFEDTNKDGKADKVIKFASVSEPTLDKVPDTPLVFWYSWRFSSTLACANRLGVMKSVDIKNIAVNLVFIGALLQESCG